jgi:hypothetical protein
VTTDFATFLWGMKDAYSFPYDEGLRRPPRREKTPDGVADWLCDAYVADLVSVEELGACVGLALRGFVPPQFPGADGCDAESWAIAAAQLDVPVSVLG